MYDKHSFGSDLLFLMFLVALLLRMLMVDPNKRISLDDVSSHSWYRRYLFYPSLKLAKAQPSNQS